MSLYFYDSSCRVFSNEPPVCYESRITRFYLVQQRFVVWKSSLAVCSTYHPIWRCSEPLQFLDCADRRTVYHSVTVVNSRENRAARQCQWYCGLCVKGGCTTWPGHLRDVHWPPCSGCVVVPHGKLHCGLLWCCRPDCSGDRAWIREGLRRRGRRWCLFLSRVFISPQDAVKTNLCRCHLQSFGFSFIYTFIRQNSSNNK